MTKEKEQRIFDVYGVTPGPWEVVNTVAEDGETALIANSPSMLIKLWEVVERCEKMHDELRDTVAGSNCHELLDSSFDEFFIIGYGVCDLLSSIHPEKLAFEEIERRVNQRKNNIYETKKGAVKLPFFYRLCFLTIGR